MLEAWYCIYCRGIVDYNWDDYYDIESYTCQSCDRELNKREILVGLADGKAAYTKGQVTAVFNKRQHEHLVDKGFQPVDLVLLEDS